MSKGITVRVDAYAAQGAARRMCGQRNLQVVFDLPSGHPPCTEKGRIHLCPPLPTWSKEDFLDWWGQLIHETRHNTKRGMQCFEVSERLNLNMQSLHGGMFNLFEDDVVDFIGHGEFVGQDETTDKHSAKCLSNIFNDKKQKELIWNNQNLEPDTVVIATSLMLDAWARQAYQPSTLGLANAVHEDPDLNPIIKERFEKCITDGWGEKLIALQKKSTAEEVWTWLVEMLKAVHNIEEPPEPPPSEEKEGDEGEEGGGAEGELGKGKRGEELSNQGKKALEILFQEHAIDVHEGDLQEKIKRQGNMTITYGKGSGRYSAAKADETTIVHYSTRNFTDGSYKPRPGNFGFWEEAARGSDLRCYDSVRHRDSLAQEVKRHIQSEARLRVARNKKKGKLDKNKLYKLNVQGAGEDWKNRVFWTKDHKMTVKNTAVSLLLDNSGSMGGTKIACGIHAMDLVGDVCQTLGVNYEMAGFTTKSGKSRVIHILYKPFGAKVQRSKIVDNMMSASHHMSSNADGENILVAYHRLCAQKADRRIMIVMSDGQPASSGGDCCWYAKQVIRGIEQEGLVEIHGLGILSDEVSEYYKSKSIVNDPQELETALLTVLKNKLVNNKGN